MARSSLRLTFPDGSSKDSRAWTRKMSGNPSKLWREPLKFALHMTVITLVAACAVKTAPPLPPTLKYAEFVYPAAVPAGAPGATAVRPGRRLSPDAHLAN